MFLLYVRAKGSVVGGLARKPECLLSQQVAEHL
jgi:hypothetical protein